MTPKNLRAASAATVLRGHRCTTRRRLDKKIAACVPTTTVCVTVGTQTVINPCSGDPVATLDGCAVTALTRQTRWRAVIVVETPRLAVPGFADPVGLSGPAWAL